MLNESQDFSAVEPETLEEEVNLAPLTDEDVEWLESVLDTAASLNVELSVEGISEFFNDAMSTWFAKEEGEREDPTGYIATAGVLAGQLIVEEHDGDWALVEVEGETQLGIVDPVAEAVLVPLETTAEIWFDELDLTFTEFLEECLSDHPDYDEPTSLPLASAEGDCGCGGCGCQ